MLAGTPGDRELLALAAPKGEAAGAVGDLLAAAQQEASARLEHEVGLAVAALLERYRDAYRARKEAELALDFDDLQERACELLARDAIGAEVRERFDLVLVDEFQDTNGLQCRLLDALAGPDSQRVFVGDACQSIYRFRYADVELFRARGERAAARLPLTGSYRSRPELLAVIGHVFAERFDERDFDPPHALRTVEPMEGPAVELHLVASEDATARAGAARELEAVALARRLRELVDGGRRRRGRHRDPAALVSRCVHLRRCARARGAAGAQPARPRLLPLAAGARPVRLSRAAAQPLRRPRAARRARLAARRRLQRRAGRAAHGGAGARSTGRSSSGSWTGSRRPIARSWSASRASTTASCGASGELGLAALLERIVAEHDYELACLTAPDGERRFGNVRKLLRTARAYERDRGPDLAGFVEQMQLCDERDLSEADAPPGGGEDAVALMTIHAAKGLEFPVVCVPDLSRQTPGETGAVAVGPDGELGLRLRDARGRVVNGPVYARLSAAAQGRRRGRERPRRLRRLDARARPPPARRLARRAEEQRAAARARPVRPRRRGAGAGRPPMSRSPASPCA